VRARVEPVESPSVASLRRTLYLGALVSAVVGVVLAVAPRFALVTVANQPAYPDYAGARMLGVGAFVFGMFMVLVAQHLEEVWWWSWAFVIGSAGFAMVALTRAVAGGASAAWWATFAANGLFVASLLWGLGRTGQQRPLP
jgi:hypothetical protein